MQNRFNRYDSIQQRLVGLMGLLLLVVVSSGGLTGCAMEIASYEAPTRLEIDGPVSLDVESFGGDVIVKAVESRQDVQVRIVREGLHPRDQREEGEASLVNIETSVGYTTDETGPTVRVSVTSTDERPWLQRARIEIEAPALTDVKIHTSRGYVETSNVEGSVDIKTDEGDVRCFTYLPVTHPVTIVNNGGDIDLRMRGESQCSIDAETIDGLVLQRVRYGELTVSETGEEFLRAVLNGGDTPVVLRTVDGDIRIAVVPDPFAIGRFIVDP